jgi:hypothetical protein
MMGTPSRGSLEGGHMKRILLLGLVTVSAMLSACSSMYERATASTEDEKVLRPIGSDRLGDF